MKINNPFQTYNRGYTARERRIRTKYASLFLVTGLACIWLTVKNYNDAQDLEKTEVINTILQTQTVKLRNQVDSLKIECDGKDSVLTKKGIFDLESELFQTSSQLGRYEMALEMLRYKNPKAANQFELILTTETE